MTELRAIQYARFHVESYASDDLMMSHERAMDCFDCEAFLKLGLDALGWLEHADKTMRQFYYKTGECDEQATVALEQLYTLWLRPCKRAHQWVKELVDDSYTVSNYAAFCDACEEVQAIVESFTESNQMPPALMELQDAALREFQDGKTTSIFSDEE